MYNLLIKTMSNTSKSLFLILVALSIAAAVFYMLPAIPQPLVYHDFADQRFYFGIPHFWNLLSNAAISAVGIYGILTFWKKSNTLWRLLYIVFVLIGLGSSYYHFAPDNFTLVWDRVPIALAAMLLLSILIQERISDRYIGLVSFVLCLYGLFSVGYWHFTELVGFGDLRPYIIAQFLPLLLIPLILMMFPRPELQNKYLVFALLGYATAKVMEYYDYQILELTFDTISGHTLKHFFVAYALFQLHLYNKSNRFLTM